MILCTINRIFRVLTLLVLFYGTDSFAQTDRPRLEYIMDMVFNNPGETPLETKYNNPVFLSAIGFNAMVPDWHVNCAITYNSFQADPVNGTKERSWISAKASELDEKIKVCKAAGIQLYPFTDFIVFPQSIWQKFGAEITGATRAHPFDSTVKTLKPDIQQIMTQALLRAQVDEIFNRFPALDGLTLRFGETYLQDTPFHKGSSPIREGNQGIEDQIKMISILREEICVKRNKKLFYRTWDFGYNFHNSPQYYLAVTDRIPPHPNLVFVMKYQQDDFHRMTPFNPTIGIGKHGQVIESQSRMEAYGKGAHPYYIGKGVIEGWPETRNEISFGSHAFTGKVIDPKSPRGLRDVITSGRLRGILTWSNGGGWKGPYIANDIWTDLNTFVMAQWALHPGRREEDIFNDFSEQIGLKGTQCKLFRRLNLLSVEAVRKGQLSSYVANNVWWTRDEFFSAADNAKVIQEIFDKGVEKKVLDEKKESCAIWRQIVHLASKLKPADQKTKEAIIVSCIYGRIKFELIEQMWVLMLEDFKLRKNPHMDRTVIDLAISRYDKLWQEWRALKKSSNLCATLYTDMAFPGKRAGSIGELVDELRAR